MIWSLPSTARPSPRRSARSYPLGLRVPLWLVVTLGLLPCAHAKYKWTPISPADLAAKVSLSAPGADREILYSYHRVDADSQSTFTEHDIRAKIYTKKGVSDAGLFKIQHEKNRKIWDVMARVVKPDGSSVEVANADMHESTALKTDGYELMNMSFAFPNVEVDDIIEFHWIEQIQSNSVYYLEYCQAADVPTTEFVFEIAGSQHDFNVMWYNCDKVEHVPKSHKVVIRNIPAFITEPLMPAESEFRGTVMILFTPKYLRADTEADIWREIGEYEAEQFRLDIAPNAAVKTKAAELTRQATSPDEKIAAIYAFVQASITNLDTDHNPDLASAKKKRQEETSFQSPGKTLDRGFGTTHDISRLFAGLVRAGGFDVRMARNADRSKILSIKRLRGWVFADRESVAVKIGDQWKFFTPGGQFIPCGMLDSKDEGADSFVCDEKKSWYAQTQIAPPEASETKRIGRFTLDEEGTLDGDVDYIRTGHRAIRGRDSWLDRSDEESTKILRESLAARLPAAEVTALRCDNLKDNTAPFVIHYHVHVPGYAESIGSRLAVPLNFFEANGAQTFTNETRRYPIFFDFAEQENDDIEIVAPEGFTIDGGSAPAPVGKPSDPIGATYTVKYSPKTHTFNYQRHFVLGRDGKINFRAESYPPLRAIYERVHRSDTHQLLLKPKSPVANSASPASPTTVPAQSK